MKTFVKLAGLLIAGALALQSCAQKEASQAAVDDQTPTAVLTLDVQGMTCTGCEAGVKSALKKVDGVKDAEANYKEGIAKVTVNPEKVKEADLIDAVNKIGFTAKKKG